MTPCRQYPTLGLKVAGSDERSAAANILSVPKRFEPYGGEIVPVLSTRREPVVGEAALPVEVSGKTNVLPHLVFRIMGCLTSFILHLCRGD